MAFGSDFRVKYLMRDVQRIVTKRLSEEGVENPLRLRVFDEDAGDNMLWDKGGLTFTTDEDNDAGSGDGAWYVEENWIDLISKKKSKFKPILVIEGTFGTETGNVGDAQKTKLSHIFELRHTTGAERGNSGLGLAISDKLAENINARIAVEGHGGIEGGAKFTLSLPKHQPSR